MRVVKLLKWNSGQSKTVTQGSQKALAMDLSYPFAGSNKIFIVFVFVTIIVTSNLSSYTMIVVGQAVNNFLGGKTTILLGNTLIILFLSTIGSPLA